MANGIVIGICALLGVWLGWFAIPVVGSALIVIQVLRKEPNVGLACIAIAFALLGIFRSPGDHHVQVPSELALSTGGIGRVESFPRPSGDRVRVTLRLQEICAADDCLPYHGCVLAFAPVTGTPLSRGDVIRVDWRLDTLPALGSGYRGFVESFGCAGSARVTRMSTVHSGPAPFQWLASARNEIGSRLNQILPGDVGALATGIVTGDDSGLSSETREAFRRTGTSHITSVSGQNVSLILSFLTMWWRPRSPLLRMLFSGGVIVIVWLYAALVGLEPPATRAAIMATLLVIGGHVGRRPDPLTILALTLGGMALWQPHVVRSVGFWLSASATFGLVMVVPTKLPSGGKQVLIKLFLGPTVATLATLPLTLATFQTWSPLSILANALMAPVMAVAFPVTYVFTLVSLIAPGIAAVLAFIPGIVIDTSLSIVTWLSPIAGTLRFGEISNPAMVLMIASVLLWLALASPESERWIRRFSKTFLSR